MLEISEALLNATKVDTHLDLMGGVDDESGSNGDVKLILLDVNRTKELGWTPTLSSLQSIEKTLYAMRGSGKLPGLRGDDGRSSLGEQLVIHDDHGEKPR